MVTIVDCVDTHHPSFILYICLESGDRLKALQNLLDLQPCCNVLGYVCTNECMVNKGTSSIKVKQDISAYGLEDFSVESSPLKDKGKLVKIEIEIFG